ncbi:MAG: tRNA pseudouridine(13) synthase TruD [Candidatus Helarchaeota archaeon]|nr:tRNA pseudouridine(13) synthase TruD [Candidatus Helarchaeota archaeon]
MDAHPIEKGIGIKTYSTQISGIGGNLRTKIEDFFVEEITSEGKIIKRLNKTDLNLEDLPNNRFTYNLVLEKYNEETLRAIRRLATFLQIPLRNVGFAGVKDKRAITVQQISISGADPKLLTTFQSKSSYLNRIRPGRPIRLGNLNGNHFQITVRHIHDSYDVIQQRLQQIKHAILSSYIPNYYGPQRFGALRPISHNIGKVLLFDDYEAALKIYLTTTFPQENKQIQDIRTSLQDSWPHADLTFPKGFFYENKIIQYLKENNLKFKKIFKNLFPFRFILFFLHAYQSYLFNKLLTARISANLSLDQAFEGDYVALSDLYSLPSKVIYEVNSKNIISLNNAINKGKAIVMAPLFGYNFNYSHHPLLDDINQLLDEENLDLSHFKSSSNEKLHLKGSYRPICFRPRAFNIELNQSSNDYQNMNVKFTFSLNKGCYATLLLREFMKTSPLNY